LCDGDLRRALNALEVIALSLPEKAPITENELELFARERRIRYDADEDEHYDTISAFIKSCRGSDPDAAMYWLAKMLAGGEDPRFIARRLVILASEDVGLADPQALVIANAAKDAFDFLGVPEGDLAIAQALVYVATAPKSNAVYMAFKAATRLAKDGGSLPPPKHILNAPTKLMKSEGYSEGYLYDHDQPDAFSGQDYFPEKLGRRRFYDPPERGFEREIKKRLDYWARLRKDRGGG
jgi:putative ATPase